MIANIVPDKSKQLVTLALKGDYEGARKLHLQLFRLSRAMFIESNPIPVKTAMGLLGTFILMLMLLFRLLTGVFRRAVRIKAKITFVSPPT